MLRLSEILTTFWSVTLPFILVTSSHILFVFLLVHLPRTWKKYIAWFQQDDSTSLLRQQLQRFTTIQNYQDLYPALLTTTTQVLGCEGASLLICDQEEKFQVKASIGSKPLGFDASGRELFFQKLSKKRVAVTKRMLLTHPEWNDVKSMGLQYCVQFYSEACVPLFVEDRFFGILNVSRRFKREFDRKAREMLELLATQFSIALQNAMLYETLLRQNNRLQETGKLKAQLLANVSHELRTPLTSIIGLSELLSEEIDGDLNHEQHDHVVNIRGSGIKLLETVNALLDISKIESNHLTIHVKRIDVKRLIDDIVKSLRLNEETRVCVALDAMTPGVYGDEERVRQVFKHLLENAAKFTKRGRISVEAEKTGEMLKIAIVDTGIGIAREKQKEIFEDFRQADGSMTREYAGLGLGLSISRRIIELHGGRLWLASKVGKGSRFYFTLPLKPVSVRYPEISAQAS